MTNFEFKKASKERNDWFLKLNGREMTFDDLVKTWGGKAKGESQVDPNFRSLRSSMDDGVIYDS